mmetsp:Transcript_4507/g.14741  ORF Transcript_4507/g.14741 Transcript_4507/m.14741 type:complete len:227 (+) Transcript_4507:511-1191(+)
MGALRTVGVDGRDGATHESWVGLDDHDDVLAGAPLVLHPLDHLLNRALSNLHLRDGADLFVAEAGPLGQDLPHGFEICFINLCILLLAQRALRKAPLLLPAEGREQGSARDPPLRPRRTPAHRPAPRPAASLAFRGPGAQQQQGALLLLRGGGGEQLQGGRAPARCAAAQRESCCPCEHRSRNVSPAPGAVPRPCLKLCSPFFPLKLLTVSRLRPCLKLLLQELCE